MTMNSLKRVIILVIMLFFFLADGDHLNRTYGGGIAFLMAIPFILFFSLSKTILIQRMSFLFSYFILLMLFYEKLFFYETNIPKIDWSIRIGNVSFVVMAIYFVVAELLFLLKEIKLEKEKSDLLTKNALYSFFFPCAQVVALYQFAIVMGFSFFDGKIVIAGYPFYSSLSLTVLVIAFLVGTQGLKKYLSTIGLIESETHYFFDLKNKAFIKCAIFVMFVLCSVVMEVGRGNWLSLILWFMMFGLIARFYGLFSFKGNICTELKPVSFVSYWKFVFGNIIGATILIILLIIFISR